MWLGFSQRKIGAFTSHTEMILAIPYFEAGHVPIIRHVAFMPFCMLAQRSKVWRTEPAKLVGGRAEIHGEHSIFFNEQGLSRLNARAWSTTRLSGVKK
jgi:hypothetical protein